MEPVHFARPAGGGSLGKLEAEHKKFIMDTVENYNNPEAENTAGERD